MGAKEDHWAEDRRTGASGIDSREAGRERRGSERRVSPRYPASAIPQLKSAKIVHGPDVVLINISRRGALIETNAHLMPDRNIQIRLVATDAVFLVKGRVLRSQARSFHGATLCFQCAVIFDEDLPLLADNPVERAAEEKCVQAPPSCDQTAARQQPGKAAAAEDSAVITIDIPVPPTGPDLRQIFGLNQW